ncbi:MAG TPA: tetratricopeptide repeat protein, partial [Alphaproteobacteria bacterium]|nr:tetratricopeptide repeat protein [Alphaproteobacteria bacterium]
MRLLAGTALALLLGAATPALADAVTVRAATHPRYGRMVFDWPKPVDYSLTTDNGRLVIVFARPVEADFLPALRKLEPYLGDGQISEDKRTLSFALKRSLDIKSFRNGASLVVDLLHDDSTP